MDVKTYYPGHPLLSRFIEYYYFLKSGDADFSSAYYAFPHTFHSLNIHRHATCTIHSHFVRVQGDRSNKYLMILQGRYELPLRVELSGELDKITIVFKPLGLNPFISRPFAEVAAQASQIFTDWQEDERCGTFLDTFYATANEEERINVLEAYLLSRYRPLQEEEILRPALAMLTDFDNEHSIASIAESISMNARSFHRLFCKNMGIPPVSFRKIARFRHSMQNKLFSDQFRSLTEIGYESNFSDQSYFINMYKKMAGDRPGKLFNSIEKLAEDHLIFKFIKEQ